MSVFSFLQDQISGASQAAQAKVSSTYHAAVGSLGNYVSQLPAQAESSLRSGSSSVANAAANAVRPGIGSLSNFSHGTTGWQQSAKGAINDFGKTAARTAVNAVLQPGVAGGSTGYDPQAVIDRFNKGGSNSKSANLGSLVGGTAPYLIPGVAQAAVGAEAGNRLGNLSTQSGISGHTGEAANILAHAGINLLPSIPAGKAVEALSPAAKVIAKTGIAGAENVARGQLGSVVDTGKGDASRIAPDFLAAAAIHNVTHPGELVSGAKDTAQAGKDLARNTKDFDNLAAATHTFRAVPEDAPHTTTVNGVPVTHAGISGNETIQVPERQAEQILRSHDSVPPQIVNNTGEHGDLVSVTIGPDRKVVSWDSENPDFVRSVVSAAKQGAVFQKQVGAVGTNVPEGPSSKIDRTLEERMSATASLRPKDAPFVDASPEAVDRALLSVENPGNGVHALDDQTKANFQNWVNSGRSDTLALEGQKVKARFADLPSHAEDIAGPNTPPDGQIHRFQAGAPATETEAAGFQGLRSFFDAKYRQLQEAGVPAGYQKDYLNQVWKGSETEQNQAVDRYLQLHPSLTKEKVFANYAEGIQAGLVPKTTDLSELASIYEKQSNRAIADTTYFRQALSSGLIQPKPGPGLEPVNGFPGEKMSYERDGKTVEHSGAMYAPKQVAELINNQMASAKLLRNWVNVSTNLKNIVLSGGVPGTAWNFHGFTTIGRDILASRNPVQMLRNAAVDVANMTLPSLGKAQVAKNIDRAIELSHAGLTLSTESDAFAPHGNKIIEGYGKVMEDPLFKSFVPATKLRFADELARSLEKKGLPSDQANKIASTNANTIFGGNNMAELGANKDVQQVMRSIFLAPDTIRSNAGTAKGVAAAIANPTNPAYWAFRAVAVNTAGLYVLMNLANKKESGHYMSENASGHTFEIQAGYDEDGNPRYIRPAGQALDFVKLPVDAVSAIRDGNASQVARIVTNRINPVVSQVIQLANNVTPFGQPITRPGDTPLQKAEKYGANIVSGAVPAGVSSAARLATGQIPAEQAVTSALELPVRYGVGAPTQESKALVDILHGQGKSGDEIGRQLEKYKADNAPAPSNDASRNIKSELSSISSNQSAQNYLFRQDLVKALQGGNQKSVQAAISQIPFANRSDVIAAAGKQASPSQLSPEQQVIAGLSRDQKVSLAKIDPSTVSLMNDPTVLSAGAGVSSMPSASLTSKGTFSSSGIAKGGIRLARGASGRRGGKLTVGRLSPKTTHAKPVTLHNAARTSLRAPKPPRAKGARIRKAKPFRTV